MRDKLWVMTEQQSQKEISEFLSLCDPYQAKISHAIRSSFMCEKFPSLLYLLAFSGFPDTLRSWPQVCLSLRSTCKMSQKCRRKRHRSIREKGTVTKAKSLFVGSLEISSKKSSHWKNAENFCHKNSMVRGCAHTRGGGTPLRRPYRYVLL